VSEPARSLLDVNVLIALHDQQHVHHAMAAEWFTAHAAQGWASCPLTQNGVLRIMSQPAYPNAQPLGLLMALFARSFAAPVHAFWPDDLSVVDAARFNAAHMHGHRQITDLYLLALAVARGGRFVTFDTRVPMSAVRGAKAPHLVRLLA
jgi:toxin-antitoxin system PIN domain toxin